MSFKTDVKKLWGTFWFLYKFQSKFKGKNGFEPTIQPSWNKTYLFFFFQPAFCKPCLSWFVLRCTRYHDSSIFVSCISSRNCRVCLLGNWHLQVWVLLACSEKPRYTLSVYEYRIFNESVLLLYCIRSNVILKILWWFFYRVGQCLLIRDSW